MVIIPVCVTGISPSFIYGEVSTLQFQQENFIKHAFIFQFHVLIKSLAKFSVYSPQYQTSPAVRAREEEKESIKRDLLSLSARVWQEATMSGAELEHMLTDFYNNNFRQGGGQTSLSLPYLESLQGIDNTSELGPVEGLEKSSDEIFGYGNVFGDLRT